MPDLLPQTPTAVTSPAVRHEPQSQGSPGIAQSEYYKLQNSDQMFQCWCWFRFEQLPVGQQAAKLASQQGPETAAWEWPPGERVISMSMSHPGYASTNQIAVWLISSHFSMTLVRTRLRLGNTKRDSTRRFFVRRCGESTCWLEQRMDSCCWTGEPIRVKYCQVIINYWPICCSTDQGKVYQLISRRRFHHLEVLECQNIFILLANIECWCKT